MKVTRRQLLILSGSAYLAMRAQTPPLVNAAGSVPTTRAYPGLLVSTFSEGFDTLHEVNIPSTIDFGASAGQVKASILFDHRVLRPSTKVAILAQDRWTAVPTSTMTVDDVTSRLDFQFDPRGSMSSVSMPFSRIELYPNENIGPTAPFEVRVEGSGNEAVVQFDTSPMDTVIAAWGAEVFVTWAALSTTVDRRADLYSSPAGIMVRSVGPTEIPAGATLAIEVDPGIISDIQLQGSPSRQTQSGVFLTPESTGRYLVTLPASIPKDETAWVELVSTKGSETNVSGQSLSTVTLSHSAAGTFSRRTGRTSSADVTQSGQPTRPKTLVESPWTEGAIE